MSLEEGRLVAGRFEVARLAPGGAVDRQTNLPVRIVGASYDLFDTVAMSEMLRAASEVSDPRIIAALHADPLVIPAGEDEVVLNGTDLVDAAIDLIDAVGVATRAGVVVDPNSAWWSRYGLLLPAPSTRLVELRSRFRDRVTVSLAPIEDWLAARGAQTTWLRGLPFHDAPQLLHARASRASARGAELARETAEGWQDVAHVPTGFDRAIELAEQARAEQGGRRAPPLAAPRPLAAAYHHRACVRWADGKAEAARADVMRAIELHEHARYLTSAALMAPRREAGSLHDRAVAALFPKLRFPAGAEDTNMFDAERTWLARGVHRVRNGDRPGAIEDLERAAARGLCPDATGWLVKIGAVEPGRGAPLEARGSRDRVPVSSKLGSRRAPRRVVLSVAPRVPQTELDTPDHDDD